MTTPETPRVKKVVVKSGIGSLTPDKKVTYQRKVKNTCEQNALYGASQPCKAYTRPRYPSDSARLLHGDTLFPRSLRGLQGAEWAAARPQLASRPFAPKGPWLIACQSAQTGASAVNPALGHRCSPGAFVSA